jgi:hypothetical protein
MKWPNHARNQRLTSAVGVIILKLNHFPPASSAVPHHRTSRPLILGTSLDDGGELIRRSWRECRDDQRHTGVFLSGI